MKLKLTKKGKVKIYIILERKKERKKRKKERKKRKKERKKLDYFVENVKNYTTHHCSRKTIPKK